MRDKKISLTILFSTYFLMFVLWSIYRATIHLPGLVDEIAIKPVLWIGSIKLLIDNQKSFRGIFIFKYLNIKSIILSLLVGIILPFGMQIIPRLLRGSRLLYLPIDTTFITVMTSLVTATVEEIVFRGFFLQHLQRLVSDNLANLLAAILFALIHLPIAFIQDKGLSSIFFHINIVFLCGFVYGFMFIKTKNLVPSIMVHAFNNIFLSFI